jgi:trimeric autotransporter adhesin
MKRKNFISVFCVVLLFAVFGAIAVFPQTTEFSYQGFITDNSASANGNYDFEFRLFDAATGGTALGSLQRPNVAVANGVFSVVLDFGNFPSANRFLEIAVRPAGGGNLTTLTPRSKLLSTPYSTNAINATNSVNAQNAANSINSQNSQNALQLGGVAANQFVQTNDARLSDARNPLPNSPNYINNSTTQQTTSNFNVSGNGTAGGTLTGNIVSATTQFNIGNARVLTSPGAFNFFAGNGAGQLNTTGSSNSFFGVNAGLFNTTGGSNAFFGFEAGRNNNAGANNSYFGKDAGRNNNTGNDNAFFGNDAGQSNTTGGSNSFFGKGAGADNTTATGNSFFGALAGNSNTTGTNNAFFGFEAGRNNDSHSNSFFGNDAGRSNTFGFNNSFFGYEAGESNVLGVDNAFFGGAAGKLSTGSRDAFYGAGAGEFSTTGSDDTFIGVAAGGKNTTGGENTFIGLQSGLTNTNGDENTFIGSQSGLTNKTGSNNTVIGALGDLSANNLTNATAIGFRAFVGQSNALILGSINGINGATADTKVGIGTTTPLDTLDIDGTMRLRVLGSGGFLTLCHNFNKQISSCSSSLRYKTAIKPFSSGLNLVNRLRPITFNWKVGGMRDLGLGAEDVEKVEPLLVTYNEQGAVEGVKYDRVAVVLLNAVKEQQVQIERQQKQLQQQQSLLEGLRKLACKNNSRAKVCK